jgi:hypothetical protein
METENNLKSKPYGIYRKYGKVPENVIFEILTGEELRRFIIPYEEWTLIYQWYCDQSNHDDYLLKLDGEGESCRIIRLDKKISEIRATELTRLYLLSRNISHILMYTIPGSMKFTVPLLISAIIWILTGIISLIKGGEGTNDIINAAVRLSSLAFILFLLLNIQFAIIRIINAACNKYDALLYDDEGYITDSLIFHTVLNSIVVIVGMANIVNLVKLVLESFKATG